MIPHHNLSREHTETILNEMFEKAQRRNEQRRRQDWLDWNQARERRAALPAWKQAFLAIVWPLGPAPFCPPPCISITPPTKD